MTRSRWSKFLDVLAACILLAPVAWVGWVISRAFWEAFGWAYPIGCAALVGVWWALNRLGFIDSLDGPYKPLD